MRAGTNSRGYTVVEVMIFLAVSGLMFIIAASFISDKQAKAEFKQGMNGLNSELRQTINDVGNGYFPDTGGFTCIAPSTPPLASGGGELQFPPGSNGQGTNKGCVFIGKVIQFGTSGNESDGYEGYKVYTVAGRQYRTSADDGEPPYKFSEASPTIVPNLTQTEKFGWGMRLMKIANNTQSLSAVGFFTAFGRESNGFHESDNSTVIVPVLGTPIDFNPGASMTDYDTLKDDAPNITLCFESGRGQFGTLTIGGGGSGQRLATKVQIYATKDSMPEVCL